MRELELPPAWVTRVESYPADGGPAGADWVRTVPRRIRDALARWQLEVDGEPRTGWTAVVLPVRQGGHARALKVIWPHPEMATEHLALKVWGGQAAVRLHAADPTEGLLLLERLHADTDLHGVAIDEACQEVGALLRRLNVPASPAFPELTAYLGTHLERMAQRPAVPRRIADRTRGLFADLAREPGTHLLLHTDLHYENVLADAEGRWRAIDPKPLRGHPGFELLPLLSNRAGDLDGRTFRSAMRRRVAIAAEAAGIDLDAAFGWTLLRAGLEVSWASALGDEAELSHHIALTKALDD